MRYQFKRDDVYAFARHIGADTHEKGKELFFKRCPYCGGGDSGDKDTLSVNLETGAFKCFRATCDKSGHFVQMARDFGFQLDFGDPARKKYKKLQQKPIETRSKAIDYLASRGIGEETARRYHITTRTDAPSTLVFPFYDETGVMVAVKYRNTTFVKGRDKAKEWFEANTKPVLFGMFQATDKSKPLIITEGQLDSLSVAETGIPNAVSVPNGCNARNWVPLCYDWVRTFPEIIIFNDNDTAGAKLIDTVLQAFPEKKIRVVRNIDYMGEKDANDILRTFGADAVRDCIENAELRDVAAVKSLASVESVDLAAMPKLMTGINDVDRAIGGMYLGQLIVLTGRRGEGKSTLASNIAANVLEQDAGIFVYSGELPDVHFKNWIDLQIAGTSNIQKRKNQFGDTEYFLDKAITDQIDLWYQDRAYIFDNTVTFDESNEIPALIDTIQSAVIRYDLKFVLVDNLMTAMDLTSDDYYQAQGEFLKNLKRLAMKLNIVILLIAHPKKADGEIGNDMVAGSAVVTNIADVVLTYSRNGGDDSNVYQSLLGITKNRMSGKVMTGNNRLKMKYGTISKRVFGDSDDPNKVYGCFSQIEQDAPEEPSELPPF